MKQRTIQSTISIQGVGIHSGKVVKMNLIPKEDNFGVKFLRTDLKDCDNLIPALNKYSIPSDFQTVLKNNYGVSVETPEHLMSAIYSCGIDNLLVEIDSAEIPIIDGSASSFVFAINSTGKVIQNSDRINFKVKENYSIIDGNISIYAEPYDGLCIDYTFNRDEILKNKTDNRYVFDSKKDVNCFKNNIYRARTFTTKSIADKMMLAGLAKGGGLHNAIILDDKNGEVLSYEKLRYPNELVRHKILDFIGDIALLGGSVSGKFTCINSGHKQNHLLTKEIIKQN